MTKAEFVAKIVEKTNIEKAKTEKVVNALLETVMETVGEGGEILLPGFGKFSSATSPARRARNMRTGENIMVPARNRPRFSAGSVFKRSMKQPA